MQAHACNAACSEAGQSDQGSKTNKQPPYYFEKGKDCPGSPILTFKVIHGLTFLQFTSLNEIDNSLQYFRSLPANRTVIGSAAVIDFLVLQPFRPHKSRPTATGCRFAHLLRKYDFRARVAFACANATFSARISCASTASVPVRPRPGAASCPLRNR